MPTQEAAEAAQPDLSEFHEYVRSILFRSVVVLAPLTLIAWPIDEGVGRGLALGGMLSILRFRVRANRLLRLDPGRAVRSAYANALLMYGMTAAALIFAVARGGVSVPALAAGVFLTNLMVLAERLVPALRLDCGTTADKN